MSLILWAIGSRFGSYYALVVFILFTILFRYKHQPERITLNEVSEQGGGNPEGMVD